MYLIIKVPRTVLLSKLTVAVAYRHGRVIIMRNVLFCDFLPAKKKIGKQNINSAIY